MFLFVSLSFPLCLSLKSTNVSSDEDGKQNTDKENFHYSATCTGMLRGSTSNQVRGEDVGRAWKSCWRKACLNAVLK